MEENKYNNLLNNRRNPFIDFIKGATIFLVIWGHLIQICRNDNSIFYKDYIFKFIYTFHMPLFMMVSGYLFFNSLNKYSIGILLKKRILNILIPLVIWNTLLYIRYIMFSGFMTGTYSLSLIEWMSYLRGLWFLWALLFCSIVSMFVFKVFKQLNGYYFEVAVILLIPVLMLMAKFIDKMFIFMFPFFSIGIIVKKHENSQILKKILKYRILLIATFFIMYIFFEQKHYIYTSGINIINSQFGIGEQLGINIFRWIIGIVGCIAVATILGYVYKIKNINKLSRHLGSLGKVSLQIYLLQSFFLEGFMGQMISSISNRFGFDMICINDILYDFVITFSMAIVYAICLYALTSIISIKGNIKCILFGR